MIRMLAIVTAVGAALWSGWWWLGSTGVERGLASAAETARAEGWTVTWDDLSVSGFPNRFDTTIAAPTVAPPDGAWRWSAPFLQVFALSYRPNHVIAVGPPEQVVKGRFGTLRVTEEDLRASVIVSPGPDLALERATVAARALAFEVEGTRVDVASAQGAVRASPDGPFAYDVALDVEGIAVPEGALAAPDAAGPPPVGVGSIVLEARATLDRPLDRNAEGQARLRALDVEALTVRWGEAEATLTGRLAADAAGLATGTLQVVAPDVDRLLVLLDGIAPEGQAALARAFLGDRGGEARVTLPVTDGVLRLGPFPLATLPPFAPPSG